MTASSHTSIHSRIERTSLPKWSSYACVPFLIPNTEINARLRFILGSLEHLFGIRLSRLAFVAPYRTFISVIGIGLCMTWIGVMPVEARGDFTDTIPARPDADAQITLPSAKEGKPSVAATPAPAESGKEDLKPAQVQRESEGNARGAEPTSSEVDKKAESGQDNSAREGGLFGNGVTQHDQDAPVKVEGDLVTGAREKGELHLRGHVVIRQANAELRSEEATVYSEPETTRAERAVAKGNVRFFKKSEGDVPPLKAEADELEYFVADRRIRLLGDPRVWRGSELIEGREIFVELDTGAVTIKGARGVIQPKPMEKSN